KEKRAIYGDSAIVAVQGDKRVAYLLPGKFPGFKTMIKAMLALEPDFTVKGVEIMEHEEDPGLGGEITQDYFKNQFVGKPFGKLKELKVVKEPLPEEYRRILEGAQIPPQERARQLSQFKDKDIYALTGATISSKAVTEGLKGMASSFAYRFKNLEKIATTQGLRLAF
ncbi:MAG: FMN-binding protein, partial [Desulfatiglandales bacterium]